MGWTGIWIEENAVIDYLRTMIFDKSYTVIYMSKPKRGQKFYADEPARKVIYAAVRNDKTKDIFAAVYMYSYDKREGELLYKVESEFCGPVEKKCPKEILSLLSPLPEDEVYAWEWRQACLGKPPAEQLALF